MKTKPTFLSKLIGLLLLRVALCGNVYAQTVMFDDFTYSGVNDSQLSAFNKWSIVNGRSGPPEGAQYSRDNIAFINDPANASNKLMTVSTTVNGSTKAVTNARIENSFEYFTGTYAARVYLTDLPNTYSDGNVQTFFTIVSSSLAGDGSKYSELDIVEYLAADKWGLSPNNPVLYTTSYHKYQAVPWKAYKTYFHSKRSWEGWHTFIASCTDGVNVKYWIDNTYLGAHSVTDNENQAGLPVYPRSPMHIAFANWIISEGGVTQIGNSSANRKTTMQVDWTLFVKDQEKSLSQINTMVNGYKAQGLQRRNLAGQTVVTTPCTAATQPGPISGAATVAAGSTQTYSVAVVPGATAYTWTLPTGWAGTSTSTSITATAGNAGGTISVKASNACGASIATTTAVSVTPLGAGSTLVQAEAYASMNAVQVENTTDVGGGQNVGWINAGSWMDYTVNLPSAGSYSVSFRVASEPGGGQLQLRTSAGTSLATLNIGATGGWQSWTTASATVSLPAGAQALRVYAPVGGWNLNWLSFTASPTGPANTPPTVSLSSPTAGTTAVAPASFTLTANAADTDGTVSKVEFYQGSTLLNTDTSAPYSYTWANVPAGTYSITAKVTDNLGVVATSAAVSTSATTPGINQIKEYTINKTAGPITVDGVLDEAAWVNTPATETLQNMDGTTATQSASAKILWSDTHLYLAFTIEDKSIWSTLTAREAALWTQDVLEILIDRDGDGVNYSEIGFAPNGNIYDLVMNKPYSVGGINNSGWDIAGLSVKALVTGPINSATGGVRWTVEVALPFAGIPATPATFGKPNAGDIWRLNIARADHNYNSPASEKLYTWTYTDGVSNHVPARFGKVIFAGANAPASGRPTQLTSTSNKSVSSALAEPRVYPNPVVDGQDLNIDLGRQYEEVDLVLTTLTGAKVAAQHYKKVNHAELCLPTLPKGIYLLQVRAGQEHFVKRITTN
ncbi:carbohydrate-binding protein [Hymenobacter terrenus]|uniref:carbohydrate-binding protein n=1 Tax=Hymenobacter terrenus TaxID=1629124 RepID=UPI0006192C4C|nr:carbohydrate-binding protein [Hymenobacter terrenus]